MADIAEIGFRADTDELDDANSKMKKLKPSAEGVEKASEKLNKKLNKTNTVFGKLARGGSIVNRVFGAITSGAKKLVGGLTGLATGIIAGFAFATMIEGARELSSSLAELSTLLPENTEQLGDMQRAARALADEFGTNAAFQVKAFYGAVSAGASDTADAINIVNSANKLAIGGITDVATGVDILTTATNAYAASGLTASDASDALFVGMKAGKTTIGELASGLGNVIPIAASLGVEMDELVAGTAALTLQGLSTASAITSLRAILSGVAKPTSQAAKLAKELGIDFSTTALRAKGLSGFLEDVVDKTGGSADKLSVLFGSVEALNAALAFAGSGGESFTQILDSMSDKAGATDEAFQKVAKSLDFRWDKLLKNMTNAADAFGVVLLSIIVPIGEGFQNLINGTSQLTPVLHGLGVVIVALAASQIHMLVTSLATAIASFNAASVATGVFTAALTAMRVVVGALGGPIGLLFALIGGGAAAWALFGKGAEEAETSIFNSEKATTELNKALAVFHTSAGPLAGQAAIDVANNNKLLAASALEAAEAELLKIQAMQQSFTNNPNRPRSLVASPGESIEEQNQKAFGNRIARSLERIAQAENDLDVASVKLIQTQKTVNQVLKETSDNTLKVTVDTTDLETVTSSVTDALTELQQIASDLDTISEPFEQARSAYSALDDALQNGIVNNDQFTASLQRIQNAFLATGGTAEQWGKIVNGQTDTVASKLENLGERSLSRLGDEFANLAVDGKASFGDLAKSIVKDLIKIMFQALVVKPILDSVAGIGGGGGGFLSTLFSAKGNSFNPSGVTPFEKGGSFTNSVVNKTTPFAFGKGGANLGIMGEAGPEAIMPLQRGADGSLGVQMYSGNAGGGKSVNNNVEITNVYKIEGAVSEEKIVATMRTQGEKTKEDVKQSLVGWLNEYDQNGTM